MKTGAIEQDTLTLSNASYLVNKKRVDRYLPNDKPSNCNKLNIFQKDIVEKSS